MQTGTDHELLILKINVRLRRKKRCARAGIIRYDTENIANSFAITIENKFSQLEGVDTEPEELWKNIKTIVTDTASAHLKTKGRII